MVKKLNELLSKTDTLQIIGKTDFIIEHISFNSNTILNNTIFIAIKGINVDAHLYIPDAIEKGVVAIVCEILPNIIAKNVTYVKVTDSSVALGTICNSFFNHPSSKLKLIGVTGTNGKTTVATLLYKLFKILGYKVGLISTICIRINDEIIPSNHTTPDQFALNKSLSTMVENGCEYCFMEVSSHSTTQNRISGLCFNGGIFTNITHDHLDYHRTFENYLSAKKKFFDNLPNTGFALINSDDQNGMVMIQNCYAKKYLYSLQNESDFKTKIIECQFFGMHLMIDGNEIWSHLIGKFNAYNLTAIYATAILLDQDKIRVLTALSELYPVVGRFEQLKDKNNVVAIIDYAHTPDAINNILSTIASIRNDKQKIITVIGAGGNRDKTKRPKMAKIASKFSDYVVLTSDNPRSEDPKLIIEEMEAGIDITNKNKVLSITDRKEAIKVAYNLAKPWDIILIAGKGHERFQEIKGIKYPFDDKKTIKELMNI